MLVFAEVAALCEIMMPWSRGQYAQNPAVGLEQHSLKEESRGCEHLNPADRALLPRHEPAFLNPPLTPHQLALSSPTCSTY
jgi:hypothetical protein